MYVTCRSDFKIDSILEQVEAEHKKQMYRCGFAILLSVSYSGMLITLYS